MDAEGLYCVFASGSNDRSLVFLLVEAGKILGGDIHGSAVDGTYELNESTGSLLARLVISLPKGIASIQGNDTRPEETIYNIETILPNDFYERSFVTIKTPLGPINARFRKIRSLR